MNDLIRKRSATERLIIAKTLLESVLQDMPTAELERKTGRWIDYCGGLKCDQCGFWCDDPYYLGEANYCPNCGARMET